MYMPQPGKGSDERSDDGKSRRSADNPTDVTNHVIAKVGELIRTANNSDRFPGAGYLLGGHGVKRPFARCRGGDAQHVEPNAEPNDDQKNEPKPLKREVEVVESTIASTAVTRLMVIVQRNVFFNSSTM
jgi:hypothetical protein